MRFFFFFILSISSSISFGQTSCSETNPTSQSGDGTGIYVNDGQYRTANDITIAPNTNFTINHISANIIVQDGGSIDYVDVTYYENNDGIPGTELGSEIGIVPSSQEDVYGEYTKALDVQFDVTPFLFEGNSGVTTTYWISIIATVSDTALVWWELSTSNTNGYRIAERNYSSGVWHEKGYGDGVYEFSGVCSPITGLDCDPTQSNPETFEVADLTTHCWSFYQTEDSDSGFVQTNTIFHEGENSYYHASEDTSVSSTSYMVSPAISVNYYDVLSFWYYQNGSDMDNYGISSVMISTNSNNPIDNPDDFSTFIILDNTTIGGYSEDEWTKHTESLAAYKNEIVYIAFTYAGNISHELYIDDFNIDFAPLANDETIGAIGVIVSDEDGACNNDTYISGTNYEATDSSPINGSPSCGDYNGGDIWFKFMAPDTGAVQIIIPEGTVHGWSRFAYALYDSYDSSDEITCNIMGYYLDWPVEENIIGYLTNLNAGETYYLRTWDDFNDNMGSIRFCIKAYTDPNAGLSETVPSTISIYPNPSKLFVNIESDDLIDSVQIYNIVGKEVYSEIGAFYSKQITTSQFSRGYYFIKVKTKGKLQVNKLIVE